MPHYRVGWTFSSPWMLGFLTAFGYPVRRLSLSLMPPMGDVAGPADQGVARLGAATLDPRLIAEMRDLERRGALRSRVIDLLSAHRSGWWWRVTAGGRLLGTAARRAFVRLRVSDADFETIAAAVGVAVLSAFVAAAVAAGLAHASWPAIFGAALIGLIGGGLVVVGIVMLRDRDRARPPRRARRRAEARARAEDGEPRE